MCSVSVASAWLRPVTYKAECDLTRGLVMAYAAFEQLTDNFLWSNPWRRHSSATAADWWHRNSRPGMDSIPKLRSGALPLYSSGFGSAHTPKAKHDTSGDRTDTRAP